MHNTFFPDEPGSGGDVERGMCTVSESRMCMYVCMYGVVFAVLTSGWILF